MKQDTKTHYLHIRITKEQRKELEDKAESDNKTLTEYATDKLFERSTK